MEVFEALRSLPEPEFERLLELLEAADGPPIDPDILVEQVTSALPSVQDADGLVTMLFSIAGLRESRRETAEVTAAALADASGASPDERAQIAERLTRVLGSPGLRLSSKATDLTYANERSIESFRIVTELRPLFADDPTVAPTTVVIVHRLEVNFFGQTGTIETRHFGLDDGDLSGLSETVARAQAKAESVRQMARKTGLRVANPIEGADER